jgi:hypothetical protein
MKRAAAPGVGPLRRRWGLEDACFVRGSAALAGGGVRVGEFDSHASVELRHRGRYAGAMPRKLKTHQTWLGIYDLAVAAPSMKAVLEAWGAGSKLSLKAP